MGDDYNPDQYLPTIDAILSVADLEQITVKKIRNALQELFGINLQPHKKEINEVILERYYDLLDKRENEDVTTKEKLQEISRKDALLAAQLLKSGDNRPVRKARKKVAKSTKKADGPPPKSGFNKEMALSSILQEIIGVEKCSRPQVVKLLWSYIKSNNLQNPADKRQINCDDKLQQLFSKKLVNAFEMNKILSKHIFKPDEIADEVNDSESS